MGSTLKKSSIWKSIEQLKLTINMRAVNASSNNTQIEDWSKYLLSVGEGREKKTNLHDVDLIKLRKDIISPSKTKKQFIYSIYDELERNYRQLDYFSGRAILTPKNGRLHKYLHIHHTFCAPPPNMITQHSLSTLCNILRACHVFTSMKSTKCSSKTSKSHPRNTSARTQQKMITEILTYIPPNISIVLV